MRERGQFLYIKCVTLLFIALLSSNVKAQYYYGWQGDPECVRNTTSNQIRLTVNNAGHFGHAGYLEDRYDCFTGQRYILYQMITEYPRGSRNGIMYRGDIWMGGRIGKDTLVATNLRLAPPWRNDLMSFEPVEQRSRFDTVNGRTGRSDEDIISIYTDTDPADYINKKLGVKVTQTVMGWGYEYTEDFSLVEWQIENIGDEAIEDFYVGYYVVPSFRYLNAFAVGGASTTGYIHRAASRMGCDIPDTLNLAWFTTNNGISYRDQWIETPTWFDSAGWNAPRLVRSIRSGFGVRFVDYADLSMFKYSYNWWDWYNVSPQNQNSYREGLPSWINDGTPPGDIYHLLANGEIDFDVNRMYEVYSGDSDYKYDLPYSLDSLMRSWHGCYGMISRGPYFISPGTRIKVVMAIVAGEHMHSDPVNYKNLPFNADEWYHNIDFTDLINNAEMAQWVYDNPGIDTDGDGYAGEFHECVVDSVLINGSWQISNLDTIWYRGDGREDYRATQTPPPPKMWVSPTPSGIKVRFNGAATENAKDVFLNLKDFEGYHIWLGRDSRPESYSLVAAYDIEDYDKLVFDQSGVIYNNWVIKDRPYTIDELRCLYADSCKDTTWHPLDFDQIHAYQPPGHPDSLFYFIPHGYNAYEFGETTPIVKRFPDARDPRSVPADDLTDDDYTDDDYLKFYDYQFEVKNLLSTVPYFVAVTAYDFGHPDARVPSLETSIDSTVQEVLANSPTVVDDSTTVYIYPNPYRVDADYRYRGLEGRDDDRHDDRTRRIYFRNLPPVCTIRIHSLDGDLIAQIDHDRLPTDPNASNDYWNVITRTHLRPVSGLYYWSVEAPDGTTQIGKLVLIM